MGGHLSLLTRGIAVALLLATGCSSPQQPEGAPPEAPPETPADAGAPAEAEGPTDEVEAAVRRFWDAATAGDMVALEGSVGFPMSLDGMCRVVSSIEELRAALGGDMGADQGIALVAIRPVLPDDEMSVTLRRALAGLAARDGNCGDPIDELVRRSASFERRYFGVTFEVAGERVERATRVSRIADRWVVTGIDN